MSVIAADPRIAVSVPGESPCVTDTTAQLAMAMAMKTRRYEIV